MKASLKLALALLIAGGLVAGCGRNPGSPLAPAGGSGSGSAGPTGADEPAQVSEALASAPELVDDGQYEGADMTRIDGPAGAGVAGEGRRADLLAAINPLYFRRTITDIERRFEFAFADTDTSGRPTTVFVTAHKFLRGTFDIAVGPRAEGGVRDTSRLRVVRKRLADHWVRHLLLKRVPPPPATTANVREGSRWRVAASSGVEVTSRGATTRVLSLEVKTASLDTVITDPLALVRLRRVMRFDPAEELTLVVTTERSDDVVVLVRAGLRARFHNNGDNTYTLVWHAPPRPGLFHVGVNALSNGTLFDDQAPYDSKAWIVPCVVSPTVLAEFIP